MAEAEECPLCHSHVSVSVLEEHVNSHLDENEDAQDFALACQLAFAPESPPQVNADTTGCWRKNSEDQIPEGSTSGHSKNSSIEVEINMMLATQRKGFFLPIEEGLSCLLTMCLEAEQQKLSCATISRYIDHFETSHLEDAGWGCGWRNIQMLSSHLLVQNWGAKDVLFGGAGFVPDISSLQLWLEFAWHQGFDLTGADWYQGKVYGSKKWIGTTECATLFRSFGLRARVVDFSNSNSSSNRDSANPIRRLLQESIKSCSVQGKGAAVLPMNAPIHYNVECDLCGVCPIRGTRFRSKRMDDYDLCFSCISSSGQSLDHFEQIEKPFTSNTQGEGRKVSNDEDVNHHSLVNWVWDYFTDGKEEVSSRAKIEHMPRRIISSRRTPLYFQHQGHSRTIIGMQRRKKSSSAKEEIFLLVLDPSTPTRELAYSLRRKLGWQKLIKRGVHTLKKREYQVCYVDPGIAFGEELEKLKIITSQAHPY